MTRDEIEEPLIRAGRMVAIGRLTPAVIHEVNNSLLVLLGVADLELAGLSPESEQQAHLKMLRDAGGDIHAVMVELAGFTRAPVSGEQPIVVEDLLRRVVSLVRRVRLQRDLGLEESYSGEQLTVRGNDAQLMQALLHLLSNGFLACREHGSASVELLREGDEAVVLVRDDGEGLPDGVTAETAFDLFVTTRAEQHGSGVGLAAARLIARRHGGDVELRQSTPEGCVFALRLPLAG
jgi:signal transduction histidine kinase